MAVRSNCGHSEMLGSTATGWIFTNSFFWALFMVQSSAFLHDPFSSGTSTANKAASSSVTSAGLSHAEPQLLSVTLPCLQNHYFLGDPYMVPSLAARTRYNLGCLWSTASLCFQETLLRRFHFNDAGHFLITTKFLAPVNQHQLSQ